MHNKIIILIEFIVIFFCGCEKNNPKFNSSNKYSEYFDSFWKSMNNYYVYWDIDPTDWDEIYYTYKPLFENIDTTDSNINAKLLGYYTELTQTLIDGHYHIVINDSINKYMISPSQNKKKGLDNFHVPFSFIENSKVYLDTFYYGVDQNCKKSNIPLKVLSGTIDNDILYISFNHFSLLASTYTYKTESIIKSLNFFFDKIINNISTLQGIIIDVRNNPGGDLGDLNFFLGHLIDEPLHFGYIQTKSGTGRLEYTGWIKAYVNPEPNGRKIETPIAVIGDMYSASLSEALIMAVKTLPNSIFIGENTWGATGPLVENEVYNAGQFSINSYMTVYTSSCKFKYIDGKIYEGIGFTPDIFISDNNAMYEGRDLQLENAINYLKGYVKN